MPSRYSAAVARAVPRRPEIADRKDRSTLTVRPGTEADAEAVVAIWNEAFVFSGTGGRRELYTAEDYRALLAATDLSVAA